MNSTEKRLVSILERLVSRPGPSGYEDMASSEWERQVKEQVKGAIVRSDPLGNREAVLNEGGTPYILLAAHIDEIGFMITHITEDGFLHFMPVGGWDSEVAVGQRVRILGSKKPILGVVGKIPTHLEEDEEARTPLKDLWIDIGVKSDDEARKRVKVGDVAVISAPFLILPGGYIVSRALDNRIGNLVIIETLRAISLSKCKTTVTGFATTREEVDSGGAKIAAADLQPDATIVIDLTHATDYLDADKREAGNHCLGGGPVITRGVSVDNSIANKLIQVAESNQISYSIQAEPGFTGTDAEAISQTQYGKPTALVSIPARYMHTPNEMVQISDIVATIQLLIKFIQNF